MTNVISVLFNFLKPMAAVMAYWDGSRKALNKKMQVTSRENHYRTSLSILSNFPTNPAGSANSCGSLTMFLNWETLSTTSGKVS